MLRILPLFLFFSLISQLSIAQDNVVNQGEKYKGALEEARKINDYAALAKVYYEYGLYEEKVRRESGKSFEYLTRSLDYYAVIDDTLGTIKVRSELAKHFLNNEMYNDALTELTKIKEYYLSKNELTSLAEVELYLAELYFQNLEIESVKTSLDNVEVLLDSISDHNIKRRYIVEKIQYHEIVRELDIALTLANECYNMSIAERSLEGESICLAKRGDIKLAQEKYLSAILDYKESLPYLNNQPYSKRRLQIYKNLAQCYKLINLNNEAYNFLQKYSVLQDSILSEERINALNNLAYKYTSEKKTREISLLELEKNYAFENNQQQKRALYVLGVAFGLLVLFIYYIVRFYKEKINNAAIIKKQNDKINQQKIKELQDKIQINSMQSMLTGQELERERISKDLHDSLGGLLSTIKLQVDNLRSKESKVDMIPEYKKATQLLDTAVGEVRSISQNLQPVALNKLGLIAALNDLINRYNSSSGPEIHFHHYDIPAKLDQMVSLGIFRIVQEIMNNAIKHAKASEILVQLNREGKHIIIHVEDDGVGFDTKLKYKSMGLENIKSRVNYLKGTIEIDSRPDYGTSYLINVMINPTHQVTFL
jgi:signal transduction histidine kinase